MPPAARTPSCSATAMAASSRCRWRSAIPASRPDSCSPIAARRSRSRAARPFATWRRRPRPRDWPRSPMSRCAGCSRRNSRPQHPDLMADRRAAFLRTDPEVFQAACAALAELDLRPELAKVKVPVLVLVGEHDEATPPPMSHELAALLPNAQLQDHSGLRPCAATAIAGAVPGCDRRIFCAAVRAESKSRSIAAPITQHHCDPFANAHSRDSAMLRVGRRRCLRPRHRVRKHTSISVPECRRS